jgi:hypothetical protein
MKMLISTKIFPFNKCTEDMVYGEVYLTPPQALVDICTPWDVKEDENNFNLRSAMSCLSKREVRISSTMKLIFLYIPNSFEQSMHFNLETRLPLDGITSSTMSLLNLDENSSCIIIRKMLM